jgi:nitrite reductase (NADH) small subunit/3-phenylpropionate/trans-cinnamate dioxygenase ferredoxin subunit
MTDFLPAAEVSSLPPGQGRTVNVQGREFALFNVDGQFHAIDNECPHAGGPLGAGDLDGQTVTCPLHGWQFDVTTGACLGVPACALKSYPTRVENGQVLVGIEGNEK